MFPGVEIYGYGPRILALEIGHGRGADWPIVRNLQETSFSGSGCVNLLKSSMDMYAEKHFLKVALARFLKCLFYLL